MADQSQNFSKPLVEIPCETPKYLYEAPHVVNISPSLEVCSDQGTLQDGKHGWRNGKDAKILGIRRQKFWLLMILLVVVLVIAVSASVGAVLATRQSK